MERAQQCPPKIHVRQEPQDGTAFGNGVFAGEQKVRIKRRSCCVRVSPGPMRVSWQRTEKDPQRPHEARSRDWSDAATSQGLFRVVRRLVSRTEGECVFLVRSRHIGSPLLRRPQETSASCTCIRSSMPTATPGGRIPTPAFQVRKGGLRAAERDPLVDVATNRTQRAIALLPPWKTIPNKGQRNIATEQDGRTDGRTESSLVTGAP